MEGATLFAMARELGFRAVEIRAVSNIVGDEFKNWNIELATQNLAKTLKNYAE
jgi:nucleoside phosphorylase